MPLKTAHVLRKLNPAEWAGTETALKEVVQSWRPRDAQTSLFAPFNHHPGNGPFENFDIERFHAFLPIIGLSKENRERLISIGGNLMSFDLYGKLKKNKPDLIHSHTLGLLGRLGQKAAKSLNVPFVLSIHGGVLDLPKTSLENLVKPSASGISYAKIFSIPLRLDRLLDDSDAIVVYNLNEERLLKEKYPGKKILHIPHGIDLIPYQTKVDDQKLTVQSPFILIPGRIDPVKNQLWIIELLKKIPHFTCVFAGSVTDRAYLKQLQERIKELKLEKRVHFFHDLSFDSKELFWLYQNAECMILPSIAEPFGRVILEAWAAGCPVLASSTSGALSLIEEGKTGFLFQHGDQEKLIADLEKLQQQSIVEGARQKVKSFDIRYSGEKLLNLYQELINES